MLTHIRKNEEHRIHTRPFINVLWLKSSEIDLKMAFQLDRQLETRLVLSFDDG